MTLSKWQRLVLSVVFASIAGVGGVAVAVKLLPLYGWTLFLVLPVLISFFASCVYAGTGKCSWGESYGVTVATIFVLGVLILCIAWEGAICLMMALPLVLVLGLIGSTLGYFLGRRWSRRASWTVQGVLILLFPCLLAFEYSHFTEPELHEVTTRIVVHAPIETVWQKVIAFDKITAPPGKIFQLGIAYPIKARIEGEGVGAIRYCEFSTGPFVEPITRWDAPHALEFDVTSNPPAMNELSPWGNIEPPHIHDAFISQKGRFHLFSENGVTVLEGTTWYQQKIQPDFYWHRISDYIIHLIHLRVMEHIKVEAERG